MAGRDVKPQRTGRRDGQGRDAIIAAALRTFATAGYHGASIRDIATEAEMTPASLYHHFTGKQDILVSVLTLTMQDALAATRGALLRSGGTPDGQLAALMTAWVEFHTAHYVEAQVSAAEFGYLEESGRTVVVALRDEQELMFREVVEYGVEAGAFVTPDPRLAARAIINMGTAVASWYRPGGALSPAELAAAYSRLALALVESKTLT